jgi:hypothetical protein
MPDGDYRDIWIATAYAAVVIVLGKIFVGENEAAAWVMFLLIFVGGTLVRQHVADRERRKHNKRT